MGMKGDEELLLLIGVVILLACIIVGIAMMQGKNPAGPGVPKGNESDKACSSNDDCSSSADGTVCMSINTVKGTQKFCGCFSSDDCSTGRCGEGVTNKNKCA